MTAIRHMIATALAVLGSPAAAADLCDALQNLVEQAQENFEGTNPGSGLDGATDCGIALGASGNKQYHCAWEFDYRAASATEMFSHIERQIFACLDNP